MKYHKEINGQNINRTQLNRINAIYKEWKEINKDHF